MTVQRSTTCASCSRPVEWATTETGRLLALELEHDPRANYVVIGHEPDGLTIVRVVVPGEGTRRAHAVTCPARRRYVPQDYDPSEPSAAERNMDRLAGRDPQ